MDSSWLKSFAIGIVSAGWLVPLWWSARFYVDYLNLVYLPKATGKVPLASAPLDDVSLTCLCISLVWLAVVIAGWSVLLHRTLARRAA